MDMKDVLSDYVPLAKMLAVLLVLAMGVLWLVVHVVLPRIDADGAANAGALVVLTDADTGCQYLQPEHSRNKEFLIQRFAPDGTQVCAPVTPP